MKKQRARMVLKFKFSRSSEERPIRISTVPLRLPKEKVPRPLLSFQLL